MVIFSSRFIFKLNLLEAYNNGQIEKASDEVLHYIEELVHYIKNERKS